jgi:hypothetical protein
MNTDRIVVALRVLEAYAEPADSQDMALLRNMAESEQERGLPLDELACEIILRERRRASKAAGNEFSAPRARAAGSFGD